MNNDKRNKRNHAKHLSLGLCLVLWIAATTMPVSAADTSELRSVIVLDVGCEPPSSVTMAARPVLSDCLELDPCDTVENLPADTGGCPPPLPVDCEPPAGDCIPAVCEGDACELPPVCEGDACDPPPVCEGDDCDIGLFDPLVCTSSGCVGPETEGGPKCRWWNQWEADVEVIPEEDAVLDLLNGNTWESAGEWEVDGELGCGSKTPKTCTVDSNPDACPIWPVEGKGDLKCDLTIRLGAVPDNTYIEITCKDPVNPCGIVRTTLRSDPLTGEAIKDYHVPVCDW